MQSVVQRLTKNKDLQTVFCYAWGDFGTEPSKASFLMMADLNNHFLKNGAFYPVGGSSEIAINIVPVIERAGGKVLVRADVKGSYLLPSPQGRGIHCFKGFLKCVFSASYLCGRL